MVDWAKLVDDLGGGDEGTGDEGTAQHGGPEAAGAPPAILPSSAPPEPAGSSEPTGPVQASSSTARPVASLLPHEPTERFVLASGPRQVPAGMGAEATPYDPEAFSTGPLEVTDPDRPAVKERDLARAAAPLPPPAPAPAPLPYLPSFASEDGDAEETRTSPFSGVSAGPWEVASTPPPLAPIDSIISEITDPRRKAAQSLAPAPLASADGPPAEGPDPDEDPTLRELPGAEMLLAARARALAASDEGGATEPALAPPEMGGQEFPSLTQSAEASGERGLSGEVEYSSAQRLDQVMPAPRITPRVEDPLHDDAPGDAPFDTHSDDDDPRHELAAAAAFAEATGAGRAEPARQAGAGPSRHDDDPAHDLAFALRDEVHAEEPAATAPITVPTAGGEDDSFFTRPAFDEPRSGAPVHDQGMPPAEERSHYARPEWPTAGDDEDPTLAIARAQTRTRLLAALGLLLVGGGIAAAVALSLSGDEAPAVVAVATEPPTRPLLYAADPEATPPDAPLEVPGDSPPAGPADAEAANGRAPGVGARPPEEAASVAAASSRDGERDDDAQDSDAQDSDAQDSDARDDDAQDHDAQDHDATGAAPRIASAAKVPEDASDVDDVKGEDDVDERASRSGRRQDRRGVKPRTRAKSTKVAGATNRDVSVVAPGHVRWLTPTGKKLGKGSGFITVPAGISTILALDTESDARTFVKVDGAQIAYERLPRGMLDIRVFPYADVWAGKKKLGTAPFPPLEVVEGQYRLKLVYEGRTERRTVKVQGGRTTRVKVSFNP